MKLSLESYIPCKKFGVLDGLRLIKDAGFDCVDMSYYWLPEESLLLGDQYREEAIKLKAYLNSIGLVCNQAHAPFTLKYGEAFNASNPNYLMVERAIESASILGAKAIVVHSVADKGYFDRQYNLDYYKSLQPLCEKCNIKVAVENLFDRDKKRQLYRGRLGTPKELCGFIRELDSPCFVACVDVGHAAFTGSEPEEFCAGMDSELLKAVHIQDGNYINDMHTLPYAGMFDWTAILKALKEVGYDGELTFEIFNYLKGFPNELLFDALCFAEKVGRRMVSVFDTL